MKNQKSTWSSKEKLPYYFGAAVLKLAVWVIANIKHVAKYLQSGAASNIYLDSCSFAYEYILLFRLMHIKVHTQVEGLASWQLVVCDKTKFIYKNGSGRLMTYDRQWTMPQLPFETPTSMLRCTCDMLNGNKQELRIYE